MIGWLLATRMGNLLLGGLTFVGLYTTFALHFEHKGAEKAVAKIEQRNAANVEKAIKARRSVADLPAGLLSDRYRRD